MVYRVGAGTSPFMPNSAGGKLACAGTFLPILFPCKYRKAKNQDFRQLPAILKNWQTIRLRNNLASYQTAKNWQLRQTSPASFVTATCLGENKSKERSFR